MHIRSCLFFLYTILRFYNASETQWAGIDNAIPNSLHIPAAPNSGLDSSAEIYYAVQAIGSIYTSGNIILADGGDLFFGDNANSLQQYINTIDIMVARECNHTAACGPNSIRNISTCVCACLPGFAGITCTTRICYNGGAWNGTACICPYPFTSTSACINILCGPNSIPDQQTCVCTPPFTGFPACTTLPGSYPSAPDFFNPFSFPPPIATKNNWGVSACYAAANATTICTCAPYIQTTHVAGRQLNCMTPQCIAYFRAAAPVCCAYDVLCEQFTQCTTFACCSQYIDQLTCSTAINCQWSSSSGCLLSQFPVIEHVQWQLHILPCPQHALCGAVVNGTQASAYQDISTYDIWDDGIDHTIVNSDGLALAASYTAPTVYANLEWVDTLELQPTPFRFTLVETPNIPGTLLGALYHIWISGSPWCLMARPLQPDEIAYFNPSTGLTTNASIAINTQTTPFAVADCGIFYVQPPAVYAWGPVFIYTLSSPSSPVSLIPAFSFAASPIQLDTNTSVDRIQCRHTKCLLSQVRAACSTAACAEQLLGSPLFQICRPCLVAHIVLA